MTDRDAVVLFVRRGVDRPDLQRYRPELGDGWVTTVEQTVVDLAARPALDGMLREAVAALVPRADSELLEELVAGHHRGPSVRRLLARVR